MAWSRVARHLSRAPRPAWHVDPCRARFEPPRLVSLSVAPTVEPRPTNHLTPCAAGPAGINPSSRWCEAQPAPRCARRGTDSLAAAGPEGERTIGLPWHHTARRRGANRWISVASLALVAGVGEEAPPESASEPAGQLALWSTPS
jgi:hypothetical protein